MKHDTKRNLFIAAAIHVLVIGIAVFFASREGMLGKKFQQFSVVLVPKPKTEEVEKKPSTPPPIKAPEVKSPSPAIKDTPQIPKMSEPTIAPAPTEVPSINFSGGAKDVIESSDPIQLYKSYIERYIHSQWKTPDNEDKVTDVEITIDEHGNILSSVWTPIPKDSWDTSIIDVFKKVNKFPSPPPKNFPHHFTMRFDTTME